MQSQKLNAELNLALETSSVERERSENLAVGYNPETREWELIIRYLGDISFLQSVYGATVTELLGGYAIVVIKEQFIDGLIEHKEIIYVEKPNNVFLNVQEEKRVSCINRLYLPDYDLSGQGIVVAVIDSGIDYAHPDFRNEDGSTRILALWDQSATGGEPPAGYARGVEYSREQIDEALLQTRVSEQLAIVPEVDLSGHGTFVAGVAAGNGRASRGRNSGVAPRSELLVVKLGPPRQGSFPRTTELMTAVDYVVRYAISRRVPISINLSFGNNYGSHDGNSLVETYIDQAINGTFGTICIGMGNEGDTSKHSLGFLQNGISTVVPFSIAPNEGAVSLQLWKNYVDDFEISIMTPDGSLVGPLQRTLGVQRYQVRNGELNIYYDLPKPYQQAQVIFIDMIPQGTFLPEGEWRILLNPLRIVDGRYDFWLPVSTATQPRTRFLLSDVDGSLTIPSSTANAISVGAYDSATDAMAAFSGRGYTRLLDVKPDLVAPGVDVTSCAPGGGYTVKSGTSIATPFVTGAAALLMEWGIVKGNDPYLYGEKVKAYLLRGARKLPGFSEWPNSAAGWGALCVQDSLPTT
ncbi:MAG: S8 family serine peptidase [Lachnospiraceae bacterium]|nr:S8 family serine peptidase [Lachnospiraceae bacterium]